MLQISPKQPPASYFQPVVNTQPPHNPWCHSIILIGQERDPYDGILNSPEIKLGTISYRIPASSRYVNFLSFGRFFC